MYSLMIHFCLPIRLLLFSVWGFLRYKNEMYSSKKNVIDEFDFDFYYEGLIFLTRY